MNKSESKYFNTAIKMDKAFLDLLMKKNFEYISVKEICQNAGVNRSTFYLHYETIGDLLEESVQYIIDKFLGYFPKESESIAKNIHNASLNELYLITPEYLKPYLTFVKDNKKLFLTYINNPTTFNNDKNYEKMFTHILEPIHERFNIPKSQQKYISAFYMEGLVAIIKEWIKNNCKDSMEDIIEIMKRVTPIELLENKGTLK